MTPPDKAGGTPRHSAVMTDVGYAALEESNAQLKLALQERTAEVGRVKAKKEKLGKWYIEECAESQREFNRASTAEQQLSTEQQAVRALDALYQSALQQLATVRAAISEIRSMPFPVEPPAKAPHDREIWNQWQKVMRICERALPPRKGEG